MPQFLRELAQWLRGNDTQDGRLFKPFAKVHAEQRSGHGLELRDVTTEYRICAR